MSSTKSPFENMGCTCFTWETKDGKHLFGRTYDQCGSLQEKSVVVVPRNYPLRLEIDKNCQQYIRSRYAFGGMAIMGLESPVMVDGVNEMGVMGGFLNYPEYAVYDQARDNAHMNIQPGFLTGYLLSLCANVEEIASLVPSLNLTSEHIFGHEMQVHFIFTDKTGETIVIEPDAGGLQIYRDTIGVMTNSPNYPWQYTNLCNYASVSNVLDTSHDFMGLKVDGASISSGGGFGLPGDYSSPSRFVRMAVMKHYAVQGENELDGVCRMFHQFSSVEIPEGIVMRPEDGGEAASYDQTLCVSAMCAESGTYYFSTCKNRRISAVRLLGLERRPNIRYFELSQSEDIDYLN